MHQLPVILEVPHLPKDAGIEALAGAPQQRSDVPAEILPVIEDVRVSFDAPSKLIDFPSIFIKSLIFHQISIKIDGKSINFGVPIKLTCWTK